MTAAPDPSRAGRKDDHVELASAQRVADRAAPSPFDELDILHHALAGGDGAAVDLAAAVGPFAWRAPLFINGMTGGTEMTGRINRELAIAARETGLAMACGSMSIALDQPETAGSFTVVRDENPDGFVLANIGAGRSGDDARRAVELIGADALQLHLNAVQETVMPEGERDFSGWLRLLDEVVAASPVPVVVKEVGFGLSSRTLTTLAEHGVAVADVGGTGGTDFLRIENARRPGAGDGGAHDFSWLTGFGQSALACLLDAPPAAPALLASGGVRNPYDVAKALAAGARAVGVAGVFLQAVRSGGADELVPLIRGWLDRLRELHALFGAATPAGLADTDLLTRGRLREFLIDRGVDVGRLARRADAAGHPAGPLPRR